MNPTHTLDEFLDLVDENDKIIGKDTREKILKKGLPPNTNIRVVNIFLFNFQNQLLVPKRSLNRKTFPGRYDFSCGEHVTSGEDYETAAYRGLEEELGITGVKLQGLTKLGPKDGVSSFMKIYSLHYEQPIIHWDRDGIEGLSFFNLNTLEKMIHTFKVCQEKNAWEIEWNLSTEIN